MKVLVADDDDDLCILAARLFRRRGWTVITASNGEQALELLAETAVDVAVLDQTMPPGSGMEVAAARRRDGDRMPIVLWTGWGGQIDQEEAARLDVLVVDKSDVSTLAALLVELTA